MITYRIRTGFFSEHPRRYDGEEIMRVICAREEKGRRTYLLEQGFWLNEIGMDCFTTDWNREERWGRVEEIVTDENTGAVVSAKEKGFIILKVNRAGGLRALLHETEKCKWNDPKAEPVPGVPLRKPGEEEARPGGKSNMRAAVDENVCHGCHICIKACRSHAIHIPNGKAIITENCIGCGSCVAVCPFGTLSLREA
jgi:ferredoxin